MPISFITDTRRKIEGQEVAFVVCGDRAQGAKELECVPKGNNRHAGIKWHRCLQRNRSPSHKKKE